MKTIALVGIDGVSVEMEVDASAGLPKTVLVGLLEMAVKEIIHRIERALANLHYDRHPGRTVINLAPADLRKDAGGFDLPIALGMLVATGQVLPEKMQGWATVGELAMDGTERSIKGALSLAMAAAALGWPGCWYRRPMPARRWGRGDRGLRRRQPDRGGRGAVRPTAAPAGAAGH